MKKIRNGLAIVAICLVGIMIGGTKPKSITPKSYKMDVPLVSQLPELHNGCEVTSLTMALNYRNIDVDKITLSEDMKKDKTEVKFDEYGNIIEWGNPDVGFVGDVTGQDNIGYAINPKPLIPLIEKYYEEGYTDLTGSSLEKIEQSLANNSPIVAWITAGFKDEVNWVTWKDENNKKVKATFSTHAVTLTGFDEEYIYYNDPLTNEKDKKVSKTQFMKVWSMMGKKALALE